MKVAGVIVGLIALYAASMALVGGWFMLVIGAVHNDVSSAVPALGFWQSILVVALIGAIGGAFNASSTVSRSRSTS